MDIKTDMGLDVGKSRGRRFNKESDYGKHIYVERLMGKGLVRYTHHGIYIGNGNVIHYSGEGERSERMGNVEKVSLENFKRDKVARKYQYEEKVKVKEPEKTIERAKSLIGMGRYNLAIRNCEHFAHWCATGKWRSSQFSFGNVRSSELSGAYGIKPLDGWLVLKPVMKNEKTEGGLFIPNDHYHPSTRSGVVVSVPDGERSMSDPVVGDKLLVEGKETGAKVEIETGILWIIEEEKAIGALETKH